MGVGHAPGDGYDGLLVGDHRHGTALPTSAASRTLFTKGSIGKDKQRRQRTAAQAAMPVNITVVPIVVLLDHNPDG